VETESRRGISRNLLVLSLFLNAILVSFSYVTLTRSQGLQSHAEDLATAYNELAEVTMHLDQQLNLTLTQLEYYVELTEYYANLTVSTDAAAGVTAHTTIPIVAVYSVARGFRVEYHGVVMEADVELQEGSGRILVNTVPRIGIDIQTSARTAVLVAEAVTGISLSSTDVILTITAGQEAEIVDGPSAGAAITTALIASITETELTEGVYMTGTINSDGTIGPVGGIPEKAIAAAENGAQTFLVPEGQGTIVIHVPVVTHPVPGWTITTYETQRVNLEEYLGDQGYSITVEEVRTVSEALSLFEGNA